MSWDPWTGYALAVFFFGLLTWYRYESTRAIDDDQLFDRRFVLTALLPGALFSLAGGVITWAAQLGHAP